MASAGVRAYIEDLGAEPPARMQGQSLQWGSGAEPPVRDQGAKPPEAESSVAFEAPADEPNLTLVTYSFCSSYTGWPKKTAHYTLVHIFAKY